MVTARRQFIKTASMFLVFAGIPAARTRIVNGSSRTPSRGSQDDINFLSKTTYTPYLNSVFHVDPRSSTELQLTLVEIIDFKLEAADPSKIAGRESFSLIFQASPSSSPLSDNTYTVEHAALGSFSLFLTGIGKREGARRYEAIISQL